MGGSSLIDAGNTATAFTLPDDPDIHLIRLLCSKPPSNPVKASSASIALLPSAINSTSSLGPTPSLRTSGLLPVSATLLPFAQGTPKVEKFSVQINRLDDLKLKKCDFIKVDTDGFDCEVLRGAIKTIEKFKPTIIFEYHPSFWEEKGDDLGKVRNLLRNYKLSEIGDGNILAIFKGQ